jgi:hypothetical protein
VLLELICYASDRGKPAVLALRPEKIAALSIRGLIEQREDGYWITETGRAQCAYRSVPDQHLPSPAPVRDLWPGREIQQGKV